MWQFYPIGIVQEDRRLLRSQGNLRIPYASMASCDRFPHFSFPRIWINFADANIKQSLTKSEFSRKLKEHFLENLASNVLCGRLLCPTCHLNM
jgi:hypothetical protein